MKKEIIGIGICFLMLFVTIVFVLIGGSMFLAQILVIPFYIAVIIFSSLYIGGCLLAFKLLIADAPNEKQALQAYFIFLKIFDIIFI